MCGVYLCLLCLGCHTWGESYDRLLEMLEDAIQGWLDITGLSHEVERAL